MYDPIRFEHGVLYKDGSPQFMLSADYPYYRDDPANWADRLRQLKELAIPVVTFYVPWRHHELEGELDFTGRTQPNRNVVHFLELIAEAGLQAIVKPGPFIHAETDFGGLPDSVEAGDLYEPMLGADKQRHWHHFLPSPMGAPFTRRVLAWFEACLQDVIRPFRYPDGPVIALQVLNEGMYSSGQERFTWYDYSPSSLAEFRRRYGGLEAPKAFVPPTSFDEVLPYLAWGRYQADYMGDLYKRYGGPLAETGLPVLTNQNPALNEPQGFDWWVGRVVPERWPVVHYGFTNWIGCVSHDMTAFNRYLLLCKRQFGPNLEENWGFSELYDKRYRFSVIPYFQTLLAMAAGASGINIYTGVGTAHWDQGLDSHHSAPYPDTAPIGADGTLHPKAETLRLLSLYLERYGSELVTATRNAPVSWGLYPSYSAVAGWSMRAEDWAGLGVRPPRSGGRALDNFQRTMRQESRDFHLVNIEDADELDPALYPAIALTGGFFMDSDTQVRLLVYVRSGGVLVLCHDMPVLDDRMRPCTILKDGLADETGAGLFRFVPENPFEDGPSVEFLSLLADLGYAQPFPEARPDSQVWVLTAANGAEHYFILATGEEPAEHKAGKVAVTLPGHSAALLRVVDGKLTAALIKGLNHCDSSYAVPSASAGGVTVAEAEPCDLLWTADGLRIVSKPAL